MMRKLSFTAHDFWIYPLYIAIACAFTAGLNIVHTKYILHLPLEPKLFIVPTVAGVIFGYLTAKIRRVTLTLPEPGNWRIYSKYIVFACLVTSGLNIAHTEWILNQTLSAELFVAPIIAGVFFGYLLARIKALNNILLKLATTDTLTQLTNRMQFEQFLSMEVEKVKRYGGTFSVIYFDIDNFKEINDHYGHQAGDKALKALATHIDGIKRKSDILARYGGDEFIILAPAAHLAAAKKLADLLKQSIENLAIDGLPTLACSFGVTEYKAGEHNTRSLIDVVDKALYAAKNSGKDTIVAFG
ncbi:MAG: GGDEF domain-containing protein [Gammaproteobacteria bacterium]|jgi:diguanylate cyclase (GGDEF)-like protein